MLSSKPLEDFRYLALRAACSLLSLSPDIISLPAEVQLAAAASQADVAAGEAAGGDAEQQQPAGRSSMDGSTGPQAPKDLLVGHRCVLAWASLRSHMDCRTQSGWQPETG